MTAARRGFLVPKSEEAWEFDRKENWPADWTGSVEVKDVVRDGAEMSMVKAWSPYVIVAILLVGTRLWEPLKSWVGGTDHRLAEPAGDKHLTERSTIVSARDDLYCRLVDFLGSA